MSVNDRWHKSRPGPGDAVCREHGKAPAAEHGEGDQWQVRWRDTSGAQRKQNFTKKASAVSFDAEIRSRLDRGTSLDLAAGRQPVSAFAEAWRAGLSLRPSSAQRMGKMFAVHVDPLPLGAMPIAAVRPSHIRAWAKDRAAVLAPSTLSVAWAMVASMFSAAVLDHVIGVSPCAGVKPPPPGKHAHFVPTAGQVLAVIAALPERYRPVAWLAAGCGWRRNEVLGLETGGLDFLRRTAEVRQQLLALPGAPPYLGPPKTADSCRVNELPGSVSLPLARHLQKFPPAPQVIWDRTDPRRPVQRPALLVFTTSTGAPVHPAWWAAVWRKAADQAGIPKGTGVHCLRHYFATLLIHRGTSPKDVQLAMGHSTPTITMNTYVGEWPEQRAGKTRSIVDAALGEVPGLGLDLESGS